MLSGNGRLPQLLFHILVVSAFALTISCAQTEVQKMGESRKHQLKANDLRLKGDLDGALSEQKTAVEITPNDTEAINILASIYYEKYEEGKKREYLQEAEKLLTKSIELNPNDAQSHNLLSDVLDETGGGENIERALAERKESVKLNPKSLVFLTNLGVLQNEMRDNFSARITYEQVLKQNPYYIYALYRFGLLESEDGNSGKSIELFERALKANPTEPSDKNFQEAVKRALDKIKNNSKNVNKAQGN